MATFGKTTDGTNVQTFSGDRIYLCSATPTTGGTVTSGAGRVRVTATSTSESKMIIFADNGGTPNGGALLAASDEVIVDWTTSTLTGYTFTGANQITVVASTPYWVGFWFDDPGTPSFEMKRDNTAGLVHFAADTYTGTTPTSPFTSGGTANGPLNASITYVEPSGSIITLNLLGVGL